MKLWDLLVGGARVTSSVNLQHLYIMSDEANDGAIGPQQSRGANMCGDGALGLPRNNPIALIYCYAHIAHLVPRAAEKNPTALWTITELYRRRCVGWCGAIA